MSSKPPSPTTKPCNIPGINYDNSFAEKLQTNMSALAGIFNFPTTQELWDLVQKDPSTKPIFDAWAGERKNFPTNLRGITHTKLMGLASNQGIHPILANDKHPAFSGHVFQQNQLPVQGKAEVNTMNLPHLTALWYIARLIREKPVLFPESRVAFGSVGVSVSQAATDEISFDPYDVFHAWKLLRWIWWVKVPKTKPRVKPAAPPVFHTDSGADGLDGAVGGDVSSSAVKAEDAKDNLSDISPVTANEDTAGQDSPQGVDHQASVKDTNNQVNNDASKDATGQGVSQDIESKDTATDTPYDTADEDKTEDPTPDTDSKQIKTEEIEDTAKRGLSEDEDGEAESGVSKKSKTC